LDGPAGRLRLAALGLSLTTAALPLLASAPGEAPESPPATAAPQAPPVADRRESEGGLAALLRALSISGFVDVTARDRRSEENVFAVGDFELDLARELGKNVQVAAALVVNDEETELAIGFVDVHVGGGLVAPRGRHPVEKGLHVQLGRFDVPFGNDWQLFAATDRVEASAPLTTEALMDGGANDVGLRVLGNDGTFGYTIYMLRGEGSGNAFGGRVSIAPLDVPFRFPPRVGLFEAGLSLLHDVDGDGRTETTALCLDVQLRSGPLSVRSEYVRTDDRKAGERPFRSVRDGWHVTAAFEACDLPGGVSVIPYARYDAVRGDAEPMAGSDRTARITVGANAAPFARLTLKAEYRRTLEAPEAVRSAEGFGRDAWLAQAVVTF
jgi:hypothetical protein